MAFPVSEYLNTARYVAEKKAAKPNWGQIAGQSIGAVATAIGKRKFNEATEARKVEDENRKTETDIYKSAAVKYLDGKQFRLPDGTVADAEQTKQAMREFARNSVRKMKDSNGVIAGVNASGKLVGTWEPIKQTSVNVAVTEANVDTLRAGGYAANVGEYVQIPISTQNKMMGEVGQNNRTAATIAGAEKRTGMTVAGAGDRTAASNTSAEKRTAMTVAGASERTNATIEAGKEKQATNPVADNTIVNTYQKLKQAWEQETDTDKKLAIQRDLLKWQPAYVDVQNRARNGGVSTMPAPAMAQPAPAAAPVQAPAQPAATPPPQSDELVEVTNPKGVRVRIRASQLSSAINQGYKQ